MKIQEIIEYATYNGVNYDEILWQALDCGRISKQEYCNRRAVLAQARKMATILWKAPLSFHTWENSLGVHVSNKNMICQGFSLTNNVFWKGVIYQGIPYAANAGHNKYNCSSWYSLIDSDEIERSDFEGKVNFLGKSRQKCTLKGVDCSGFIYNAYEILDNYNEGYLTTGKLLESPSWEKIEISSAMPGDILLKKGHVMIYVGVAKNGKIAVLESTADDANGCSGCRYFEFDSVFDYEYYRYVDIAK